MACRIVTLMTDFGLRDPYVAEMKASILELCLTARIVDLSHEIEKFNIRMGAYILAAASPYFPKSTIHVAVIDPTVGMERKPILIETNRAYFLGPDNGLLALACPRHSIEHVYEITNRKIMLPSVSATFHGRDVFAPAAAHLANGKPPNEFGPEIREIIRPAFAVASRKRDVLNGEVLYVDSFGNVVLNANKSDVSTVKIGESVNLKVGNKSVRPRFSRAFGDVGKHKLIFVVGSNEFLELSVNQGNAAEEFGIRSGDKFSLKL